MSKSARTAIPSSPASRSSLTPPAASSASPKSTPTLLPKSKPQKSNPPRSKFWSAAACSCFSVLQIHFNLDWLVSRHLNGSNSLVGQPILAVPLFFPSHRIVNSFPASLRSSACSASLRLCVSALSFLPSFFCRSFNFRLSTSLSPPPVYNELPSWLLNPACLMAFAPASSSKPPRRASRSATPSRTLSIPPSLPPAPVTRPASSAPRKSPTSSASISAPQLSIAAITPCTSTPISNLASKTSAANSSGRSSTRIPFTIPSSKASATFAWTARKPTFLPSISTSTSNAAKSTNKPSPALGTTIASFPLYSSATLAPSSTTFGTSARCPIPSVSRKSNAPPKSAPSKLPVMSCPSPPSPPWCTPSPALSSTVCGA